MMKIGTYSWIAGTCLLLLSGAELVGVLELFEPFEIGLLVAAGALLVWEGAFQRKHCRHVVGTIGALYLLVGMSIPALAVLSEALVVSYDIGLESLFAVAFGLLSLFAAAMLPEPAKPSSDAAGER